YVCLMIGGLLFLAILLSWRIGVNDFSMQNFYRDRLVNCYLAASDLVGQESAMTRFNRSASDVALSALAGNYPGPYPILNASLSFSRLREFVIQCDSY